MSKQVQIIQHNAITTARYEYNETQLNIFFYLLSKVRSDNRDGVYTITLADLSKMTGKEHQPAHIKATLEEMMSRVFHINTQDGWLLLMVFQSIQYINGGKIVMTLTHQIIPYLTDLKANFTQFQLYSALRLRSKYAKRIYTLCSQWKSKGVTPYYDILEFKKANGLFDEATGEEKLKKYSSFEARVLKEAVTQINELTDLRINYEMKKEGQAFKAFRFTVQQQDLAIPVPIEDSKTASVATKKAPATASPTLLDDLVYQINQRPDCPLNSSDLRSVLSTLLSWGATEQFIRQLPSPHLTIAKKYAYSVRMMDDKPISPLAELIAQFER